MKDQYRESLIFLRRVEKLRRYAIPMREPGKVGALSASQALLASVLFAAVGVGIFVLRTVVLSEPSIVSLAVASGAFVAALLMLVAWQVAKRRTE